MPPDIIYNENNKTIQWVRELEQELFLALEELRDTNVARFNAHFANLGERAQDAYNRNAADKAAAQALAARNQARQDGLAKLTPDERAALGLS